MRGKSKTYLVLTTAITAFVAVVVYLFVIGKSSNIVEESVNQYLIKGIDISHHNTVVDWAKVKGEDVSFAYIKATEGTDHLDRDYVDNVAKAREQNIKVGAYHFYIFGTSGKEQAHHFIQTAQCQAGDLIPAIDVEHSPTNPHSGDAEYLKKVVRELKVLEEELYNHYGSHPVIYTNRDCYKLYIDGNFEVNPIWIVNLDEEPSSEIKGWRIWQFSHSGRVAGVKGKVDLNFYRYSPKEFSELFLK